METGNYESKSKMEDFAVIELIGRGSFGAAFLVLHKTENKKYVLKKIRLSKQTEKFKSKAYQEMNLIAKLRHPYILEYKDAWVDKGSCICIVTNYCEVGNISELIRKARRAYFSEEKICKWLTQLLLAIDYLHSNRVLHRDLKLSNIFVTEENDILLGDFGLAKLLNEEGLASSVAVCLRLLHTSKHLERPKQIIKSMLRKSPEHRPTAAELLRHPHLQPFLLRCHNPSTVFLPVKSPSPNNGKEKTKNPSPSSSNGGKDYREKEVKLKQRELLPLFEESTNMQYPNLLDGDALIEDLLETKRVDPTSYSGKISHDSEDTKSGDTCETTACNGDDHDNYDSSPFHESVYTTDTLERPSNALCEEKEDHSLKNTANSGKTGRESQKTTACNGDDHYNYDSSPFHESVYTTDTLERPSNALCEEKEEHSLKNTTNSGKTGRESEKTMDKEPLCSPELTEERKTKVEDTILEKYSKMTVEDTVCSDNVVSHFDENMTLTKDNSISEVDAEPRRSSSVEKNTGACSGVPPDGMQTADTENYPDKNPVKSEEDILSNSRQTEKETINNLFEDISSNSRQTEKETINDLLLNTQAAISSDGSNGNGGNPGQHRADALESLLELCARLLKQDKFEELSGVLKAFGEDAVSSRETAIWLTKSLMNAQKLAKDS